MKIAKYALAALGLIAFLAPTAKADTFVYQVTSTFRNIDVIFDLPSFQETVTPTTFIQATSSDGPITEFALSGNSTGCSVAAGGVSPGPCLAAFVPSFSNELITGGPPFVPFFSSPGTFHAIAFGVTTTVTITQVPTVPEPSALALIPLGLVVLLVMRKRLDLMLL